MNNFHADDNQPKKPLNISDAPNVSEGDTWDNKFVTDYDQGWLDGYTTGVLDGCTHADSQTTTRVMPGSEVVSDKDPSLSEKLSVPNAQITSRQVQGRRGPWGQIIPAK